MPERLDPVTAAPNHYRVLAALDGYLERCGLDPALLALVQMRAAQINDRAPCPDPRGEDDCPLGESEPCLDALVAWSEASIYNERERAALLWTEELTLPHQRYPPHAVYENVRQHFDPRELVKLTLAIVTANARTRLAATPAPVRRESPPQSPGRSASQ